MSREFVNRCCPESKLPDRGLLGDSGLVALVVVVIAAAVGGALLVAAELAVERGDKGGRTIDNWPFGGASSLFMLLPLVEEMSIAGAEPDLLRGDPAALRLNGVRGCTEPAGGVPTTDDELGFAGLLWVRGAGETTRTAMRGPAFLTGALTGGSGVLAVLTGRGGGGRLILPNGEVLLTDPESAESGRRSPGARRPMIES